MKRYASYIKYIVFPGIWLLLITVNSPAAGIGGYLPNSETSLGRYLWAALFIVPIFGLWDYYILRIGEKPKYTKYRIVGGLVFLGVWYSFTYVWCADASCLFSAAFYVLIGVILWTLFGIYDLVKRRIEN